jgi:hypothetical protein
MGKPRAERSEPVDDGIHGWAGKRIGLGHLSDEGLKEGEVEATLE